jgi:FAD/FMN-containing dehydrogenase
MAPSGAHDVDAAALAAVLRPRIRGEVRFDDGSRALYATDGSNYRQVPIGVVIPRGKEDVEATLDACREFGAPVFGRGCGTSLAGQCCNVAVCIDFTKYLRHVLRIDADRKLGTVEPGCVLDDLRGAANKHGLTFGPDPATHTRCTLGGILGNDSCGVHSLLCAKHGRGLRTADNTHELEVLTYDDTRLCVGETPPDELERIIRGGGRRGEIYARLKDFVGKYGDAIRKGFPKLPRRVSGYNLPDLLPEKGFHVARALVGSESTLVTILEATLDLVPNPKARSLLVLGYPDVYEACNHLMEILAFEPIALEGLDHLLFQWVKQKGDKEANIELMPPGKGFLLVGFEAEHYEVSQAVGEHGVLPKVRRAGDDTLIVTDGFSCRQQIEQATDRHPLHLAELLRLALHQGEGPRQVGPGLRLTTAETVVAVGAAALGGWLLARWLTRRTPNERATAVRGPGVEDLRRRLFDRRRGDRRADELRPREEVGGQPLHGHRGLP